jgi:SAM-dependent methyltransferase
LRCAEDRSRVLRFDGEVLPFKGGVFDAVLAINALEHMPLPWRVLEEVFRVLRRGGLFLAITPDRDSLVGRVGRWLVEYTSLKNPYHVGLMNKREMGEYLGGAGFGSFAVLPFHNGFLGAPFIERISRREFIPIPTYLFMPFSHHQMVIALKP